MYTRGLRRSQMRLLVINKSRLFNSTYVLLLGGGGASLFVVGNLGFYSMYVR